VTLPNQANAHIPGYAEFTLFTKTTRLTIGAPAAESNLRFKRIFKESTGIIILEIEGSLQAGATGQVEGSTDFAVWNTVTVVTKAALDALNGIIQVNDAGILVNPPSYKFYRIVIP
jgi:asparagine synthetase A